MIVMPVEERTSQAQGRDVAVRLSSGRQLHRSGTKIDDFQVVAIGRSIERDREMSDAVAHPEEDHVGAGLDGRRCICGIEPVRPQIGSNS